MNILRNVPSQTRFVASVWQTIKRNWLISIVHKFVLLLFVLSIACIIWRWKQLPPLVPLWYSRPWGNDQLASPYWLFLLPAASILWYSVDLVISVTVMTEHLIFTQILFLSALIVSLLSFVTLIKILFLIT